MDNLARKSSSPMKFEKVNLNLGNYFNVKDCIIVMHYWWLIIKKKIQSIISFMHYMNYIYKTNTRNNQTFFILLENYP